MVVILAIAVSSEAILLIVVLMPRNSIVGCNALRVFDMGGSFLVHRACGWRGRRRVTHFRSSDIQS